MNALCKEPEEYCLSEEDAAAILIHAYGPLKAGAIMQSTDISWFIERDAWAEMAKTVQYGLSVYDFVVDDHSQLVFAGVSAHVELIPTLLWAKTGKEPGDITQKYERMDEWVIAGNGCFKSKAGSRILMSRDYQLPPELKLLSYRSTVIE